MSTPPSAELALCYFQAEQAFSAALAKCQAELPAGIGPIQAVREANRHGFALQSRPFDNAGLIEVRLRHAGGHSTTAHGSSVSRLLAGLLGLTLEIDGLEPVPLAAEPEAAPSAVAAAESLAAATDGEVFEVDSEAPDPATPLSDEQIATAIDMVKQLSPEQRKAMTIAFRDAFRVDRSEKSIIPSIAQLRHLQFIDRFTVEANGGVAE